MSWAAGTPGGTMRTAPLPAGAARRMSWWTAPGRSSPWWASGATGARSRTAKALFLADKPEWRQLGLTRARLRFTTESPEECVRGAARPIRASSDYIGRTELTRGLFYRGVE